MTPTFIDHIRATTGTHKPNRRRTRHAPGWIALAILISAAAIAALSK